MTMVNNVDHDYISKSREVRKDDITIVPATCRLHVDSVSNINIVSSIFINSLPGEYVLAGISKGRILQALSTGEPPQGQLVFLLVKMEFLEFETAFRIIENDDVYFNILVGYYTQAQYNIFVIPPLKALYCIIALMKTLIVNKCVILFLIWTQKRLLVLSKKLKR